MNMPAQDHDPSLSFKGYVWEQAEINEEAIARIRQLNADMPEIVARLLVMRDVAPEEAAKYLNPKLKDLMPSPFSMAGMEAMADELAKAIQTHKKIAIFGDFDVDGATSSAVLFRFLKYCGIEAPIYIPQRLSEGYGPNIEALQILKDQGAEIVIMLDCGTPAFEEVQAGRDMGLDIYIFDHHLADEKLPNANHVINPQRADDASGLDMMAAVGVTFMCCVAVNIKLREAGFYKTQGIDEPKLMELLDLVAFGTVADMMDMRGINRAFVRAGLQIIQNSANAGLRALIDVSEIKGPVEFQHLGFRLGPRVNAGSRVGDSTLGAQMLSLNDYDEALAIALRLDQCNEERKATQKALTDKIIGEMEGRNFDNLALVFAAIEESNSGLNGLIAGRLKDKYDKPAVVASLDEDAKGEAIWRGSARSVAGVDVGQALKDAEAEGLIEKGGGHKMAGGFTALPNQMEAFEAFLHSHVAKQAARNINATEAKIYAGVMTARGVNESFVRMVEQAGPYDQKYPEPRFMFQNVRLYDVSRMGDGSHIRARLSDWEGGGNLGAIAFGIVDTPLGQGLLHRSSEPLNIIASVGLNHYNGRTKVQLYIHDAQIVV